LAAARRPFDEEVETETLWNNRSQMLLDGGVPDKDNFTVPSRQREHKI
jgi:hypothetical protein